MSKITEDHLSCIANIYDLLLNPGQWPTVLDQISDIMQSMSATPLVIDERHPEAQVSAIGTRIDQAKAIEFVTLFATDEEHAYRKLLDFPPLQWMSDEDVLGAPVDSLPATLWLQEHADLKYRAIARLNGSRAWCNAIAVQYHASRGPITMSERETGAPLLPHLAKVMEINRPLQVLRARFQAVIGVLDRFHMGVVIVTERSDIVVANHEADRILELGRGVSRSADGRIQMSNEDMARTYADGVRRATATTRSEGVTAETKLTISDRRRGSAPIILEVSPLRGGGELEPTLRGAIVFMIDPENKTVVSVDGMREHFALTNAEAEVLTHLIDGRTASEVADIRDTSITTSQTQIRAIYEKTETKSRTSLVRLALDYNLPIDK